MILCTCRLIVIIARERSGKIFITGIVQSTDIKHQTERETVLAQFLTFLNDDIKAAGMADEDICLPVAPTASFPQSVTSGLLLINVTTPSSGGGAVGGCGARNAGRVEQTVGDSLPCSNVDIGRHFDFNVGGSRIA